MAVVQENTIRGLIEIGETLIGKCQGLDVLSFRPKRGLTDVSERIKNVKENYQKSFERNTHMVAGG